MKKTLLLLFLFPLSLFAQEKNNHLLVKWNPTGLIDIFTLPTAEFAVETQLSQRLSLEAEFGTASRGFAESSDFSHFHGGKANMEVRYYLTDKDNYKVSITGPYIGMNVFYRMRQLKTQVSYFHQNSPQDTIKDDFDFRVKSYGANILCGYQGSFSKRFYYDTYLGIGIAERKVTNFNREYNPSEGDLLTLETDLVPFFRNERLSESSGVRFNMTVGFRLGYLIWGE